MSLYKRKGTPYYWVKECVNGRKPVQKSTGTTDYRKAQEFEARLRAQLWEQERLGVKPQHSWEEAAGRWINESQHKATHWLDVQHLKWLHKHLGDKMLSEVDRDMIERLIKARKADDVSNASVNRTLQVVRVILRRAVTDWDWLDKPPKFRWLPEPKQRVRYLIQQEADKLVAALPPHLADMARFSLETGLRMSNVTGLKWSWVDLSRRHINIPAEVMKARKPLAVPLSVAAVEVVRAQIGKNLEYVFSYLGKPVKRANQRAWRNVLAEVGIKDFHWHDLRHTWASWHVQAGTPLYVLQALGGWESVEMVQKYAHLSSDHLTAYVERRPVLRSVDLGVVATK